MIKTKEVPLAKVSTICLKGFYNVVVEYDDDYCHLCSLHTASYDYLTARTAAVKIATELKLGKRVYIFRSDHDGNITMLTIDVG
jgi:hypothetical protein